MGQCRIPDANLYFDLFSCTLLLHYLSPRHFLQVIDRDTKTNITEIQSFLAAALYLTLKHIVRDVGPQYSLIKPKLYPYIFIACDIFSLLLQAIGGGVASSAEDEKTTDLGGNIMLAGIIFQVVTFTALYLLIALYLVKLKRNTSTLTTEAATLIQSRDFKIFVAGMFLASLFIFVRCVYRIAELAEGWANEIMRDEIGYIVLDGV